MAATSAYLVKSFLDAAEQETGLPGWGQRYTQLSGGKFRGSTTFIDFGRVAIGEERLNLSVAQATSPPAGKVVLVVPMGTGDDCLINGDRYAPVAFIHRGGCEINVVTGGTERGFYVVVDERALPAYDRNKVGPIVSVANHATANELRAWLSSILASAPDAVRHAPGEMEKVLPGMILDKFSELCELVGTQGTDVKLRESYAYAVFLRAQRRLDADPDGVLSVAGLAAELDVPDHVLRAAFLQTTGLSTGVWLRQRRLDRARRALTRTSTSNKSVAQVAMENGFFHLGRFAAYYAQTFHETPLETIRSALT
ncbi:helix-turn-helix domain-containing protein [Devosia sp.]|uniref:helix-turn-helix domain-containing protein n=1 Tax=Devosia sp. TaxID=1871048 RepID=UPI0019F5C132|nr:helix-turn-helix domain-containing protein [Devosia sp.]MBE0579564.1 helix-turn-helix domain-containing protein [Devosia sp.]